jgi:hypothetical protein
MRVSLKNPFVKGERFNTFNPDPAEIRVEGINENIEIAFCNGGWYFQ